MWPFSKKKKGGTVSAPPKRRATHFATVSRGGRNYVVFYDAVGDIIEELLETAFILAMTLDDFNEYGWDYPTEAEALAYADEVAAADLVWSAVSNLDERVDGKLGRVVR